MGKRRQTSWCLSVRLLDPFLAPFRLTDSILCAVGGVGPAAFHCSGGRKEGRDQCFNLRLMWRFTYLVTYFMNNAADNVFTLYPSPRRQGLGELYTYLPFDDVNTSQLLKVPPKSYENPNYGFSVGRGAFYFAAGKPTIVTERIKLNDIGLANGTSIALYAFRLLD